MQVCDAHDRGAWIKLVSVMAGLMAASPPFSPGDQSGREGGLFRGEKRKMLSTHGSCRQSLGKVVITV
jgi:hypothetical protein